MTPKPSEVLGAYEWAKHGGTVEITDHPGGRHTVTYVSREDDKFRSWKQCLNWFTSQLPPNLGKQCQRGSKRPFLETHPEKEVRKSLTTGGMKPAKHHHRNHSAISLALGSGSRVPAASNTEGQLKDKPSSSMHREPSKRQRAIQCYDSTAAQPTRPVLLSLRSDNRRGKGNYTASSTVGNNLDHHKKGMRSASREAAFDNGLAYEKQKAAVPRDSNAELNPLVPSLAGVKVPAGRRASGMLPTRTYGLQHLKK